MKSTLLKVIFKVTSLKFCVFIFDCGKNLYRLVPDSNVLIHQIDQQNLKRASLIQPSTTTTYRSQDMICNGMEISVWKMEDARMEWNGGF